MRTKCLKSEQLSWRISAVVTVVVFLTMAGQVTSQSSTSNKTLLRRYCRSYNVMNGQSFLRSLNATLSNLRRQLSDPSVYYADAQTTIDREFSYGFALCREYLTTSQCLACFDSAVADTRTCGIADGGNVIYDDCSIRYENYGVSYDNPEVILDDAATPLGICGNETTSRMLTTFNSTVEELLSAIRVATPRISDFYVASTRQVSNSNATVYAIAQCIRNTSQAICQNCLMTAYNNLRGCLPSSEGRAIDFMCFMRYSVTPYFQGNQTTNIIPFEREGSSSKSGIIIGVSCGSCLFFLLLALLLWYRLQKKSNVLEEDTSELHGAKRYSYEALQLATNNFNEEYRVGKGGYGEVFKAFVDDENVVAVKKLFIGYGKAKIEFNNEVHLISNVHHRNLVQLLGWSSEGPELLLVFEYMPQGSLDNFLWGEKRGTLNWKQRFEIIFGIARGLAHLHEEFHVKIIHRDIKSSNILLDDAFQPKIADFGLARFQPEGESHVSTKFAGTMGYTAPEYATRGHLSEQVDAYSFGIVVLEIVSGRSCSDVNVNGPYTDYLLEHAWKLYEEEVHIKLADDALDLNKNEEENVKKIIEIALMCTQSPFSIRPTMSEVVQMLSTGQSMDRRQITRPTIIDVDRRIHKVTN